MATVKEAVFLFEGTDKTGKIKKGEVIGTNANLVKAQLRKQGIVSVKKIKKKPKEIELNIGPKVKASEIEHAIKAHRKLKLEDDTAYFQSLSLRLNEIIENYEDKWDELVRQLLLFRDGIEKEKGDKANDLGLNETEFAFYNILNAEVVKSFGEETFSDEVHERILSLVKKLVNQFEESSKIASL